jgi:hypothetical protein
LSRDLSELIKALQVNVHTEDAYGWALHRAGRSDEALPHARAAVRLNSPYAPLYYHLGVVEAAVGGTPQKPAPHCSVRWRSTRSSPRATLLKHGGCCSRWSRHDRASSLARHNHLGGTGWDRPVLVTGRALALG